MLSGNVATSGASQRNTQVHFTVFGPTTNHGIDRKSLAVKPAIFDTLPTNNKVNLWIHAFEIVQQREANLVEAYKNHLDRTYGEGLSTTSRDLSNPQYVKDIVSQVLDIGEQYEIYARFPKAHAEMQEQIEKLAKILRWSGSTARPAISDQPYAALAWSGIAIFLPLLANKKEYSSIMLRGFDIISEMQIFWKSFEDIYIKSSYSEIHQDLEDALAELYSLIFGYQVRAICHLSKQRSIRALEYMAGSENWTERIKSIQNKEESCLSYISEGQKAEIHQNSRIQLEELQKSRLLQQEILSTTKEHKQDKEERGLLNDLATVSGDYERYKNINPKRVSGTCEWFLQDERYCKWRDSESGDLLWVSAGPGRGKSVLTKSLIDEGQLDSEATITITSSTAIVPERVICYFFFKDGGEGKMDGAHALCAILHQLFKQTSTSRLIKHALASHKSDGQTLTQKTGELWRILVECANSSTVPIICVLDALDECNESGRTELIDKLYELYDHSNISPIGSKLKFFITSRPYDNLKISFNRLTASSAYLHFDGDDKSEQIGQEINLVIDVKVKQITGGFSAEDCDKISKRLKSMENQTYLWLHLTLSIIQQNISAYSRRPDIEEFLTKLPSAVSDAYEKILSRSQDESKVEALLQIVLAAERPLTLNEANYALALALEEEQLATSEELQEKLWPQDGFKTTVQNLCGLFISIYDSKLSFIHQTAREFLIHPERTGTWKGRLSTSKSHGVLSGACINYLLTFDTPFKHIFTAKRYPQFAYDEFKKYPDLTYDELKKYPFFSYAAESWFSHFRSQDAESTQLHRKHARDLCRASASQTQNWALTFHSNRLMTGSLLEWTDLHIAIVFGLASVVNDIILHEQPDVNTTGKGNWETLLSWATRWDHLEVMEVLLGPKSGVRVIEDDICALVGHRSKAAEMLALLLDKRGGQIEITNNIIKRIILNTDVGAAVMAVLLDKRPNEVKITPHVVQSIAWEGSSETMALLLDKRGHKVKITEEIVEAAAKNRFQGLQMLALLLDRRGHEIQITEDIVKAAAGNFKPEMMALLLDRRGDKIQITEDIIKAAAGSSTPEIMALLLDRRGHEVQITEDIVKAIAELSKPEMMALLLDRRGDKIQITEDIIKAAARRPKPEIMALLLDRCGDKIQITEDIVKAAAGSSTPEMVSLLLDRRGDEIQITEDIVKAAAGSSTPEIMALLLDRRGHEINVTDEIISITQEQQKHAQDRDEIIALLQKMRDDTRNRSDFKEGHNERAHPFGKALIFVKWVIGYL